jgi:cytochrome c553
MPSAYLLIQLYLFRENQRRVDPMNDMAKGMTDADLQTFADFIEKLPRPKMEQAPDQARMERARALVAQHRCGFCHSPDYSGHDNIPRLAAQREDYLLKALREYKSNARVGYDTAMIEVVQPLKDADLVELAYFMAHSP